MGDYEKAIKTIKTMVVKRVVSKLVSSWIALDCLVGVADGVVGVSPAAVSEDAEV